MENSDVGIARTLRFSRLIPYTYTCIYIYDLLVLTDTTYLQAERRLIIHKAWKSGLRVHKNRKPVHIKIHFYFYRIPPISYFRRDRRLDKCIFLVALAALLCLVQGGRLWPVIGFFYRIIVISKSGLYRERVGQNVPAKFIEKFGDDVGNTRTDVVL